MLVSIKKRDITETSTAIRSKPLRSFLSFSFGKTSYLLKNDMEKRNEGKKEEEKESEYMKSM